MLQLDNRAFPHRTLPRTTSIHINNRSTSSRIQRPLRKHLIVSHQLLSSLTDEDEEDPLPITIASTQLANMENWCQRVAENHPYTARALIAY